MERRKKTYTAAILNIVAFAIYIVSSLVSVVSMIVLLAAATESADADAATLAGAAGILIFSYLINLALDIVCLVLSCKCLGISKMSVQDYASKKSVVTACYVINIIIVVLGLLSLITSGVSLVAILDIAIWAMLIVAAVFFIIDLKKNQEQVNQEQAKVFAETASSETAEEKEVSSIDKLDELNKMKADGLISDEEFENMKKDLLK